MIGVKTPIKFLSVIYGGSLTDMANISVAEAEDDYNTILRYLAIVQNLIADWIEALKRERDEKK